MKELLISFHYFGFHFRSSWYGPASWLRFKIEPEVDQDKKVRAYVLILRISKITARVAVWTLQ